MKVTFTRKEFTRLIELAYIGEWVATATEEDAENPYRKRYRDLMQKLYKLAAKEEDGCPEYVDDERDELFGDEVFPSRRLEEESPASKALGKFENDNFWDELIARLAERDNERNEMREPVPATMPPEEMLKIRARAIERIEDKYRAEFVKNDLGNVFVMFGSDRLS